MTFSAWHRHSKKQKQNVRDDEDLNELSVIVSRMKEAAKEQNKEISTQIKTVDKLKAQTTHETSEMDKVKTRLKKVASWFDKKLYYQLSMLSLYKKDTE